MHINIFDHRHAVQRDRIAVVVADETPLADADVLVSSHDPANWQLMNGCVGLDLWPLIRGDEDDEVIVDLALLWRSGGGARQEESDVAPAWMQRVIGSWTCVAGTAVGVAGGAAKDTDRYCKTITAALTGEGSKLQTITGTSIVTFPTGTVAAAHGMITIPDVHGAHAYRLAFHDVNPAATPVHALVSRFGG